MKYLNFGYEYSKCSWVYPDCIYITKKQGKYRSAEFVTESTLGEIPSDVDRGDYLEIPNKGLRILANFTRSYTNSFWFWGSLMTSSSGFGLEYKGNIYPFRIENSNLLAILQSQGIEDGRLRGTYKISELGGMGKYRLIPEGTPEDITKTEISEVYYDNTKPFTKKMKPGHLYITKTKQLMLCLGSDLDYYSKELDSGSYLDYYWRLNRYSDTPRKVKLLVDIWNSTRLDDIEKSGVKSIQDLLRNNNFRGEVYSDKYAGKDLGPFLSDDGRTFKECLLGVDTGYDYHFIDGLFVDDPGKKKCLIDYIKSENGERIKNDALKRNPEISKLLGKLGL